MDDCPKSSWFKMEKLYDSFAEKPQWWAAVCSVLLFAVLQLLRPYYFLTDDNLTGFMPVMEEVLRRIWLGQNIFENPYLFGGGNFFKDPGSLGILNPVVLPVLFFPEQVRHLLMVEWVALVSFVLGSWAFVQMAKSLSRIYGLPDFPGAWIFLSLSWNFGLFSLAVGSSWLGFLGSQAAVPLLFWGMVERNARRSLLLLLVGAGYGLFCGHMHPFLMSALFFSLMVVPLALMEKRWGLLLRWGITYSVYLALLSPWLYFSLQEVGASVRQEELALDGAKSLSYPLILQMASLIAGPIFSFDGLGAEYFRLSKAYMTSIAFTSSGILFGLLLFRNSLRWKKACWFFVFFSVFIFFSPKHVMFPYLPFIAAALFGLTALLLKEGITTLEKVCLLFVPVLIVLLDRPDWLTSVISQIPVYRFLRWPVREVILMTFLFHVILLFNWQSFTARMRKFSMVAGVLMMAGFIAAHGNPSFSLMEIDRRLIISGEAAQWWKKIKSESGDAGPWIAVVDVKTLMQMDYRVPFTLTGSYNYPSFFEIRSLTGYCGNWIDMSKNWSGEKPYHWAGIFGPEEGARLRARNPELCYVEIKELGPDYAEVVAISPKTGQKWTIKVKLEP